MEARPCEKKVHDSQLCFCISSSYPEGVLRATSKGGAGTDDLLLPGCTAQSGAISERRTRWTGQRGRGVEISGVEKVGSDSRDVPMTNTLTVSGYFRRPPTLAEETTTLSDRSDDGQFSHPRWRRCWGEANDGQITICFA